MEHIVAAVRRVDGVDVEHASTGRSLHPAASWRSCRRPAQDARRLSMAYTPGVARLRRRSLTRPRRDADDEAEHRRRRQRRIRSPGLGDIGPGAAMPVMEGKPCLQGVRRRRRVPDLLDTKDVDEIASAAIAPASAGSPTRHRLPRCFEIERVSRRRWTSPSSTTTSTGPRSSPRGLNALRVVGKEIEDARRRHRRGAAGIADEDAARAGVRDIAATGSASSSEDKSEVKRKYAELTNLRGLTGSADNALTGADAFIGLRARRRERGRDPRNGRRRDRVRDGEPNARSSARRVRRRRDRGLRNGRRLSESDRTCSPSRLPHLTCARRR